MRFKYFLLFLLMGFSKLSFAVASDSINVCGKIVRGNRFSTGVFFQYGIEKHEILNFKIDKDTFSFSLPSTTVPGVYRLRFDSLREKPYVDIIINGIEKSIVFDVSIYGFDVAPLFKESNENNIWYTYLQKSSKAIDRLNVLFQYLSNFHFDKYNTDRSVMRIYQKERNKYYKLFDDFVKVNANTWSGLLVLNKPYYFSDLSKKPIPRDFIRKNYFWEDVDTNNSKLICTPVYAELIDMYFDKYYLNSFETFTGSQKKHNLKKGADLLIEKFSNNPQTKEFIFRYLKDYFKRLDMQDIITYVNQKEVL